MVKLLIFLMRLKIIMLHQTKFRNKIIVVQTESNKSIPKEYVADLSKVKKAIAWLKNHNSLYSH